MNTSRIPKFANKSREGMSIWFAEMSLRGLLFHPEEAPSSIFTIATNERAFTPDECAELDGIMAEMFELYGDRVCETCYPIFMKAAGIRLAA
ncbi:MAG: hypothetical protein WBG33_14120 [Rhodanobacter sp.]|jgi:hypothetical protein